MRDAALPSLPGRVSHRDKPGEERQTRQGPVQDKHNQHNPLQANNWKNRNGLIDRGAVIKLEFGLADTRRQEEGEASSQEDSDGKPERYQTVTKGNDDTGMAV